jgi:hypothetical protein
MGSDHFQGFFNKIFGILSEQFVDFVQTRLLRLLDKRVAAFQFSTGANRLGKGDHDHWDSPI